MDYFSVYRTQRDSEEHSSRTSGREPVEQQQDNTPRDPQNSGAVLDRSSEIAAPSDGPSHGVDLPLPVDSVAAASAAETSSADANDPVMQQSPRSLRRPRFVRSNSSNSLAANSTFEFYRRGRRSLASHGHTPATYEGPSTSSPSGNNTLRQPPMLSTDAQLSTSLDSCNQASSVHSSRPRSRPRQSTWEAGHASHWRRIETRHTINPDIGAAHIAHLGRVPDTSPPPPATRGGGNTTAADDVPGTSVVTSGDGSNVEAEVAQRSRPTLLMASPSASVPSATIAPG